MPTPPVPTLTLPSPFGDTVLHGYEWLPVAAPGEPRAVVVISHGMAEHAARYARFAAALTAEGFAVYAFDHRGHGHTGQAGGSPGRNNLGHMGDHDSWNRAVGDLAAVCRLAKARHPGKPLLLFSHSMGSFMGQQLLYEHGNLLAGAVLCGSTGKPPAIAALGRLVTRIERLRLGRRGISMLVQSLSFDAFNKRFQPQRTDFDWLSRDTAEVDKYIADPFCGFPITVQSWIDLLDGLQAIARPDNQARIPKALPIFVIAGTHDPVSGGGRALQQLLQAYASAGLSRVESRFYDEARHELLNEINRDAVTADVIGFFRRCL